MPKLCNKNEIYQWVFGSAGKKDENMSNDIDVFLMPTVLFFKDKHCRLCNFLDSVR